MDRNILEVIRLKKKVVKLSAVAFMGAVSLLGVSRVAHAMKPQEDGVPVIPEVMVESQKTEAGAEVVVGSTENCDRQNFGSAKEKGTPSAHISSGSEKTDYESGKEFYYQGECEKAIECFESELALGNHISNCWLGLCWLYRDDGKEDRDKAKDYLKKVIGFFEAGHATGSLDAESYYVWGCLLLDKRLESLGLLSMDPRRGSEFLQEAVNRGHVEAISELANCYKIGKGTEKDEKKAFQLCHDAVLTGKLSANIEVFLGCCYAEGVGVVENIDKAFFWLRLAANGGNVEAKYNLGVCYEKENNLDDAIAWYKEAAEQGLASAQCNLGMCYKKLCRVDEAIYWLDEAAAQGDIYAKNNLGVCYEFQDDIDKAIVCYKEAADQGCFEAKCNLGWCYFKKGKFAEAIDLLKEDAERGIAKVQYVLGVSYKKNGSFPEAIDMLTKAADQGYAKAQFELGRCYLDGRIIEKNIPKATDLFSLAASQGFEPAKLFLDRKDAREESVRKKSSIEGRTSVARHEEKQLSGESQAVCRISPESKVEALQNKDPRRKKCKFEREQYELEKSRSDVEYLDKWKEDRETRLLEDEVVRLLTNMLLAKKVN